MLPDTFPDAEHAKPYDCFSLFYADASIELIADMTNMYALRFFNNPGDLPKGSRFLEWRRPI